MANQPITTAAGSLGASGLNDILTFISDQFLGIKRHRMALLNFINTDTVGASVAAKRGDTARVHVATEVASRLLTDGNAVVLDDDLGSSVEVSLSEHRYTAFSMTQVAQALNSGPGVLTMQIQQRIASMLNDVETDIMSLVGTGFTTNVVNAYNTAMDEDDVLECTEKLDDAMAPEITPRFGLLRQGANAYNALSKLTGFNKANERGNLISPEALSGGAYARGVDWHGVNWHKTQAVNKTGSNIDNFVGCRDALLAAFKPFSAPQSPGVEARTVMIDGIPLQILLYWDGNRLSDQFVVHLLYGTAVGVEDWGVLLKS